MLATIYISLFFFLVVLALAIVFIITIVKTLNAIAPENRKMEPGKAWLLLIPLFNLIWVFNTVSKVSESIYAEFSSRGLPVEKQPTLTMGMIYGFSLCLTFVPVQSIVYTFPVSFMAVIFWIIYWVKLLEYKNKLEALPPKGSK
jgi:hypothetical protein